MQAKALGPCDVRVRAKCTRHSHLILPNDLVGPLFKMHTDVHCRSNASVTGDLYFVSLLEDHTDCAVATLIKFKSDVEHAITNAVESFEKKKKPIIHWRNQRCQRAKNSHGVSHVSSRLYNGRVLPPHNGGLTT